MGLLDLVKKLVSGSGVPQPKSRRCFERIEVILTFDDNRQLTERQIERGEFITAEEYAAYEASQSHPDPG